MGDDLNQKFAQISELLNQEGMADNIKGIISMLSSSNDSKESNEIPPREEETVIEKPQNIKRENHSSEKSSNELEQNLEMMRQVQKVMDVMRSSKDDPRVNLLNAIRPYLNNSRQKKVSTALKFLQMSSITKLMDIDGKSLFK